TNVRKSDNTRAVGTFIPNNSPVVQTVLNNQTFLGRAFVVNDWYITAYEPILNNGEIVGMLYVGGKEKDLDVLRNILSDLKIGKSGYIYVLDATGTLIMHPEIEGTNLSHKSFIKEIIRNKSGIINYNFPDKDNERISAYDYFDKFELYVAASITKEEETSKMINGIIVNSILIGVLIIIIFSIFVYFITTKNIHKILTQVEHSKKQLSSTKAALMQSEKYFQTLFNNSSDEIYVSDFRDNFLEVNDVACDTLKYSKTEFLKMGFRDIKTKKYRDISYKNLETIKKLGKYTYESEHITKDGKVIPIEMKSKIIDYKNGKAILTIARDITERKEIEERILITGIETEQKERKRFAADLHDDLAPILSTIKLYSDLLKKHTDHESEKSKDYIKNIDELVDLSIASTKEISNNIRPNVLQDFGLAEAINDYCSYINETKSIKITVSTENYNVTKRGIEETILYQATKELINNTLKYADAKKIRIEIKNFEDHIIFYYKDDGIGFDAKKIMSGNKRLGLNNIFNKVKTLNGTCDLNSSEEEGMFLLISLKLDMR
ncbi:MAG: Cache 3/Cache 2 fusion domain-containing protein, partial [Bacteroidales bacterium]|nr:Cache 3/Cache 2 fusion domain-containing protein [Bacteroidales bacterium]